MGTANNGLLDGARRLAGKFRDLDVSGGLPGAPLGLRLRGATRSGPPSSGTWRPGDLVADRSGALWASISGGTPGQWAGTQVTVPPTGDQTGGRDTAAINAVIGAGQAARLLPGTYYVTNLLPDTYGAIIGSGRATILQAATGTTGYVIALKAPATTKQVTIANLVINCNQACAGILLDNTGFQPDVAYTPYDPMHSLESVIVFSANGDAFHFDNNAREIRVHGCIQYFASGYGFYLGPGAASDGQGCTDCHFTDCTSGPSGSHGWYVADTAANNMFTSCKAFYSGFTESTGDWDTTSCGFEILSGYCAFVSCSAQQAALHGFDLQSSAFAITITGCEADTNSAGGITTGVGINLNGVSGCSIIGNTGSVNTDDPPGAQVYGIQTSGTITGTSIIGNSLSGTSGTLNRTDTDGGGNSIVDSAAVQLSYPFFQTQMGLLGLTTLPSVAQYFALVYGWDGSGGSGYAQLGTTTGAGLAAMLQMSKYSATSPVTVTAASITSLGSLSVPADDPVAGARYKVTAHGTLGTASSAPAYVCDLRWGGTGGTLLTSVQSAATANSPALAVSLSAVPVLIEGEVEFYTSTTCVAWLRMTWRNSATAATASTVVLASVTSAVTVTTSSAESLSLDWTWSATGTGTTITIASSSFERVA